MCLCYTDDHDPDMSAAVSILGKRKRMQNALSLENLKHRKTCPACGKVHGNAKKGQCGNTLLDGTTCNYTFVVQQRGRSKVQPPPNESMPTDQRPLKKVHDQFVKLINEVRAAAVWCTFVVAILHIMFLAAVKAACVLCCMRCMACYQTYTFTDCCCAPEATTSAIQLIRTTDDSWQAVQGAFHHLCVLLQWVAP